MKKCFLLLLLLSMLLSFAGLFVAGAEDNCTAESHIYDDEYDSECNICSEVREISISIGRIGDADGNGKIDVRDATLIQKALVDLIFPDEVSMLYADVDSDGIFTIRDATAIRKFAADIKTDLNTGDSINVNVGESFLLGTDNYSDSEVFMIKVKASDNNGILTMTKSEDVNRSDGRQMCSVDFSDGTLTFYKADGRVMKEKALDFPVVSGNEYVVEMIKLDSKYAILKVTDVDSEESNVISCLASDAGRGWGKRTYTYTGDNDSVISAKSYILQKKHTRLLIVGDSYVEGYALSRYTDDTDNRYATQIKNALDGDCFIYARGGAGSGDILIWFNEYLPDKCLPEYTIVSCGGNDQNFYKWKSNYIAVIDKIRAMGSEPILATIGVIPTLSEEIRSVHAEMNEWIMNESGCKYIDVNLATSLNGDRFTMNPEYLLGDGIHPNGEGHNAIFERVLTDAPYIFLNN